MEAVEYRTLKERQRAERDSYHPNLALRAHRALSWLSRAEQADDLDGRFIFLWIAFNAAYATEIDEQHRLNEQLAFTSFLQKLCDLDKTKRIENTVWQEYPSAIRNLLNNPFAFKSFWDGQSGKISEEEWQARFTSSKRRATRALGDRDTDSVLGEVCNRLCTLRNQLVHGGATCSSKINCATASACWASWCR